VDRYSFNVGLSHPQLHAGFSRRFRLSRRSTELSPRTRVDPGVLAIRDRVVPIGVDGVTMDSATLVARWADGVERRAHCAAFPGSPGNPLSDRQLEELLRIHARGLIPTARLETLVEAVWRLADAASPSRVLALARCG